MTRHATLGRRGPGRTYTRPLLAAATLGVVLGGVVGCTVMSGDGGSGGTSGASGTTSQAGIDGVTTDKEPAPAPEPEPTPEPAEFTILAAGDVLPHAHVDRSALLPDGTYDFSDLLSGFDDWASGADLALCHMEVPVSPEGEKPSGYPMFGAPPELVTDLAEQGWDGCSTASNHSLDRGWDGVTTTLDAFDAAGLGHVGTGRTEAEALSPQLYELERADRTITVAHLSATFSTNGIPLPADQPWAVDLIDADRLVEQATAARADGADLVVVSMHAGTEYTTQLTDQQVTVSTALAESGEVDLLIGHHAHVPQEITRLDGGPDDAGMWVAYGLGNFVSNQSVECCVAETSSGVVLTATVVQEPEGPAHVTGAEWSAVTVDRADGHAVHVIEDVVDDTSGVGTLSQDELETRLGLVEGAVGEDAPERSQAPTPTGPEPSVVTRSTDG
ncbi:hypothetical protein GCM10025865_31910 [Paraoerskovia sediminicola]|uniref:Capsule synthesis protein CapA domain-containing protein n=1 Tax=Paraoerskovia sediminicola TaxID=1138587 RepID=A0ABN6XJI6_9CELL|nr:CapA family protein [Paraoerskovia sediminicola]BDZ43892.1 hypothetical protein GCM10025865_31910 [Paraoerskovia sediminicola]